MKSDGHHIRFKGDPEKLKHLLMVKLKPDAIATISAPLSHRTKQKIFQFLRRQLSTATSKAFKGLDKYCRCFPKDYRVNTKENRNTKSAD